MLGHYGIEPTVSTMSTEDSTESVCSKTKTETASTMEELKMELYLLRMENQRNEMLASTTIDMKNKHNHTLKAEIDELRNTISSIKEELDKKQQLLDNSLEDRKKMDLLLEEQRKKEAKLEEELSSFRYAKVAKEKVASLPKAKVEKKVIPEKEKSIYSQTTLETEIKQLQETNERLKKEVLATRDWCLLEAQRIRKEASDNPQVIQYAKTVESVTHDCELPDDLKCIHCGANISTVFDTESTNCVLCRGLLEVHKLRLRKMNYEVQAHAKREDVMRELDLKYQHTLQIRNIALVILGIAMTMILSIRF